MENKNLELWNSVEKTDPSATKRFKRAGGFSGTSIDPVYQIKRATSVWGPIGDQWGYTFVEEKIIPLSDKDTLHYVYIDFWYTNEAGKKCSFRQVGQTLMVANGRIIEEAPKMSLTDALTKALSWLGFSADIWLGEHDGAAVRKPPLKDDRARNTQTHDQKIMRLTSLIKKMNVDVDKFLGYYKVSDIDMMSQPQIDHAIKTLENRK